MSHSDNIEINYIVFSFWIPRKPILSETEWLGFEYNVLDLDFILKSEIFGFQVIRSKLARLPYVSSPQA